MNIVTQNIKLSEAYSDDVYSDLAEILLKKFEKDPDDLDLIRKSVSLDERSFFEPGEYASVDYITTKYVDHDGDIIVPSGIDLSIYRKNRVVLWCHNYWGELPIGKNAWIELDEKGLIAKTIYHTRPGSMGLKVWEYLSDGFPLGSSIGFIGIKASDPKDVYNKAETLGLDKKEVSKANRIYEKVILLEYSRVPVPSNYQSVNVAIAKGLLSLDDPLQRKYFDFSKVDLKEIGYDKTKEEEKEAEGSCQGEDQEKVKSAVQEEHDIRLVDEDLQILKWSPQEIQKWIEDNAKSIYIVNDEAAITGSSKMLLILEKRVGSRNLPISDSPDWDGDAARSRMAIWAGGPDKEKIDWNRYAKGFAYSAPNADKYGDFKLPFADVINGTLTAVWGGVKAAMAAVLGSRGGVDIPEEDRVAAYNLLKSYYAKFDKPVPDYKSSQEIAVEEMIKLMSSIRENPDLLRKHRESFEPIIKDLLDIIDIKQDIKQVEEPAVEEDLLLDDISGFLSDILGNVVEKMASRLNVDEIVDETIKRLQGKVF